jgi:chromate transport protein ChrA
MLAFCAGAGWLLRGWAGSLAAVTSVTVPSAAIAVVLLATFDRLAKNPVSAAGLSAMIAAAVGLLFASAFGLLRSGLKGWNSARTLILAGAAFLLAWRRTLSPFEIILLIAAAGSLWPEEGEGKPE